MKYDGNMDKESIKLCDAMNLMPGISTFESCCGHGEKPYHIAFMARSLKVLPDLLYWFDGCHTAEYGWLIEVGTDCGKSPVHFVVVGPIGQEAYEASYKIADYIINEGIK